MQRRGISLGALLILLLSPLSLGGQDSFRLDGPIQPHPEGIEAINQLRSPYCPGMMLEVCPSPQAKMLRDTLELLAWAGEPSDTIVAWMLARYGEEYRALPLIRGSGLWAWLMPPMALLAGIMVLVMALRQFRAREEVVLAPEQGLSQEDESLLVEALEELKASEEVPF
jgi:cytochrome c-type biogenesis protein CcmH/NrfF